jgi:hypothetical protein
VSVDTTQTTTPIGSPTSSTLSDHLTPTMARLLVATSATFDGSFLYVVDYGNRIRRADGRALSVSTLRQLPFSVSSLTSGPADQLYAVVSGTTIIAIDKRDARHRTVLDITTTPGWGAARITGMAADSGALYAAVAGVGARGVIARIDPATATLTTMGALDPMLQTWSPYGPITSAGAYLYFGADSATAATTAVLGHVAKMDKASGTVTFVDGVSTPPETPTGQPTPIRPTGISTAGDGLLITTASQIYFLGQVTASTGGADPSIPCAQTCTGDPINTATGEFFLHPEDLSLPAVGPQVELVREYSSTQAHVRGPFGHGWTHTFAMSLHSPTAGTSGIPASSPQVAVIQENGSPIVFERQGDGSYAIDAKVQAELTRHLDGSFTFTRHKSEFYDFDEFGRLLAVRDLSSNALTLYYGANNQLGSVVDAAT